MSPKAQSKSKSGAAPDFEKSLKALEKIVERLEGSELPLEKAVEEWEKGIELRDACSRVLQQAEQKVEVLMKKGDGYELEPLDED